MRPKTIICDIDGTLVKHGMPADVAKPGHKMDLLPGTIEKLLEWESAGYRLILLTGRRESIREMTIKQLSEVGITYDSLIMGVGGGCRVLINDKKPTTSEETAVVISPERNKGIEDVHIT